jgi:hypothetical protein
LSVGGFGWEHAQFHTGVGICQTFADHYTALAYLHACAHYDGYFHTDSSKSFPDPISNAY